jgi:hypothetical protein
MADTPDKLKKSLDALATAGQSSSEPVHLTEDEDTGDRFLLYATDHGIEVQLRYERDGLWMTQAQMAELFGVDRTMVTRHLRNVYDEGELDEEATSAKIAQVRVEGGRKVSREILSYDLNAVISVGYRVSSKQATMFRKWATEKLVQFATKGFVVDVERLKAPAEHDHFRELREIIREIRASEANLYQELKRIISLCSDYAAMDEARKNVFFATVQNKLLYAISSMTAAELRVQRASAAKENMGLTTWKGRQVTKSDIGIAKNYLGDAEIKDLNRFTTMLLDYFEQETELRRLVQTTDAEAAVDKFIRNNERHLLHGAGSVSKREADAHCEAEYDKFDDRRRLRHLHSEEEE